MDEAPLPLLDDVRPPSPISAAGHRQRMRQRLLRTGGDSLADHELLEMVLFLALPRRDTKAVARALLSRFGSYAGTIAAPVPDLLRVEGVGDAGAAALKTVQAAALRLIRAEVTNRPVLANWDRLMAYLNAAMARERVEQFRILFLDTRNRLLADEAQTRGTVDHTPVCPREVAKRALELHAASIILVHNHPSGDPTPLPRRHRHDARGEGRAGHAVGRGARPHHRRQRKLAQLPAGGTAVDLRGALCPPHDLGRVDEAQRDQQPD